MNDWEKALDKFLKGWKKRKYVIGAVLTGSFAAGTQTPFSDIDVHIILSDKVTWRERGIVLLDGYEIEYFVNPAKRYDKYFKDNYLEGRRTNARMLGIGKILFDKTGEAKKVQQKARKMLKKKLPKPHPLGFEVQKYDVWDCMDNLKDLYHHKSPNIPYFYYLTLDKVIRTYAKYLRAEVSTPARLERFLHDAKFRKNYQIDTFPDKQFLKLAEPCLFKKPELKNLEKLVAYSYKKMGGFEIDGWRIRVSA